MSNEVPHERSNGAEPRRRLRTLDEKRRIVAKSFEDGASVAVVARRHGVNANLLFTWRRQLGADKASKREEPRLIVPVTIAPQTLATPGGRMEITLSSGERIVVGSDVEAAALARVVKALRQ
jgi:transposase